MIPYIDFATLIIAIFYIILTLIIFRGLCKKYERTQDQPKISILIPARNEEEYLPACLTSISELTYPKSLTQIIILDDRSTDETHNIASEFCARFNHFQLLSVSEDKAGLAGKMNVLNQGLSVVSGEIILVTDADCEVTPSWADKMVAYFTPDTGMVGGITMLSKSNRKESLTAKTQALDWLFLQGVASGSAGSGFPTSILGNNFAFRKQAYLDTGGYKTIGFSLTEDMVLMRAIQKLHKWQIKYPLELETAIYSQPVKSLRQLIDQRRRWIAGGMIGPLSGWVMMITALLSHVLPFICLFTTKSAGIAAISIILPILTDFLLIVHPLVRRIQRKDLIKYFPVFELYYFMYTTVFAVLAIIPIKIQWKNRGFQ
jgi:cellulose synthase/poly-beta-1,6-N-acetylglucosamine synthase-like glycosyltransferase